MTDSAWEPILDGESAAAAGEIIAAISEALETYASTGHRRFDPGRALLHAYLAKETSDAEEASRAFAILEGAIDAIADARSPGLYGGFTGIAWLTMHLQRELAALAGEASGERSDNAGDDVGADAVDDASAGDTGDDGDSCSDVDSVLLAHVRAGDFRGDYDLIHGLVGIGVYALERLERPSGHELAELVVRRLAELAEETPAGTTWFTQPERLVPHQRAVAPEGYYNVGLAHGVPGVVAFLAHAHRAGIAPSTTSALLDGAFAWVVAQQLPTGAGARYPAWVANGVTPKASRCAWCYGGLGIASALLVAANSTGKDAWRAEALKIASMEAERPFDSSGCVDAGLCHGAAGNAHLFNRMFQATGEPRLRDAARSWLARAIELRTPNAGIAGYRSWAPADPKNLEVLGWVDDTSFLTGAAGIALALLAAKGTTVPRWDRLLLCDAPQAARPR